MKNNIIGSALINNTWKDIETIDESRLKEEGFVRVIWRDNKNRRVTSFVTPSNIKKY